MPRRGRSRPAASAARAARPPRPPRPRRQPPAERRRRGARSQERRPRAKHYEAGEPEHAIPARLRSGCGQAATPATGGRQDASRAGQAQSPAQRLPSGPGGRLAGRGRRAGLGAFRPIYEGNNGVGRGKHQRIPLDFGDDTISSEEQAYIRYDSMDRSFLFVPNLSKTNVVAINDKKPTGALKLELMDVITMGRTQLAFVPFCGEEFDWSELSDLKE